MKLLNRIIEVVSINDGDRSELVGFRPLASWFFRDFSNSKEIICKERDFVLSLHYLKERHRNLYEMIDIPPEWDGRAHEEHPEWFDDNYVELIAIRHIRKIKIDDKTIGPFDEGIQFSAPRDIAENILIKHKYAVKADQISRN